MCQHSAGFGNRKVEYLRITHLLVRTAGLRNCEDIVPESSQFFDDRKRKILTGVEAGQLFFLILTNQLRDLVSMSIDVGPRIDDILSSQGGVRAQ